MASNALFIPVRQLVHSYRTVFEKLREAGRPAVLTSRGVPVAALFPIEEGDLDAVRDLVEAYVSLHSAESTAAVERAEAEMASGEVFDVDEIFDSTLGLQDDRAASGTDSEEDGPGLYSSYEGLLALGLQPHAMPRLTEMERRILLLVARRMPAGLPASAIATSYARLETSDMEDLYVEAVR